MPPAGFEPAHPAPEAGALSPELRGPIAPSLVSRGASPPLRPRSGPAPVSSLHGRGSARAVGRRRPRDAAPAAGELPTGRLRGGDGVPGRRGGGAGDRVPARRPGARRHDARPRRLPGRGTRLRQEPSFARRPHRVPHRTRHGRGSRARARRSAAWTTSRSPSTRSSSSRPCGAGWPTGLRREHRGASSSRGSRSGLVAAAPGLGLDPADAARTRAAGAQAEGARRLRHERRPRAREAGGPPPARGRAGDGRGALPSVPFVAKVEVAGPGFLNVFTTDDWLHDTLRQIVAEGDGLRTQPRRTAGGCRWSS